ncbi:MAG: class II fructose-bisphosphate aldolase [Polyangiaceae bacterium]|jgi:fructose-bisphosphate aldolase class II
MAKLKLKPGVITGSALKETFEYMKSVGCAVPAVNVIGSHSTIAALQAAREAQAPIIIQFSNSGAHFFAGKFLDNKNEKAAVAGAVAGAHFVRNVATAYGVPVIVHTDHAAKKLLPWVEGMLEHGEKYYEKHGEPLFSSHMLDLSEEPLHENLEISSRILRRMSAIKMTLEIELGVTGGEEDGVDNAGVENSKLYTQPSEVLAVYDALKPIGNFTVAASFGNTHGVYMPGNVKLRPVILKNSQETIQHERKTGPKPVDFVFHGGSGSSREEIREAVSYGVVKMNIDTDVQWAFCQPIRKYMDEKSPYLQGQLGNPKGPAEPNKKYIDPRSWLHLGEKGMVARLVEAFKDLDSLGRFEF